MKKQFTNESIQTFFDDDAEKFLQQKNDSKYIVDGSILKVDLERWKEAQIYEKKTWMEFGLGCKDDRNLEHSNKFDSYNDLNFFLKQFNSIFDRVIITKNEDFSDKYERYFIGKIKNNNN